MKRAEKRVEKGIVVRERVEADEVSRGGADGAEAGMPYGPDVVSHAWKMAVNGIRNVVCFGAMLCEVGTSLSRETRKGCIQDGETLKAWLEENCPEINYKTAMKFRRMAEITLAAARAEWGVEIGPGETAGLLGWGDGKNAQRSTFNAQRSTGGGEGENAQRPTLNAQPSTGDEAKRAALESFLDGKSQRDVLQLWAEGGSRPGRVRGTTKALAAPRERKSDEEVLAGKRAEAAQALMTARNCLRALTTDLGRHLNPVSARSLLIDIRDDIKVIAAGLESF